MDGNVFQIRINWIDKSPSKTYSADFQTKTEYSTNWKNTLKKAHGNSEVFCCCQGSGSKRLAVRYMTDTDSFHLARFPETGHEHSTDCIYYAPDPSITGAGAYAKDVLEETSDGGFRIKLAVGLKIKGATSSQEQPSSENQAPSASKPSMSLLGLLHTLWTHSGMNRWSPAMQGKRDWGKVHKHINLAASKILASRLTIEDCLLVGTFFTSQEKANEDKVKNAAALKRRLVLIAPMATYTSERDGGFKGNLPLKNFGGMPYTHLPLDLWKRTKKRFESEFVHWRSGGQVVVIGMGEFDKSGKNFVLLDIAVMAITDQFIPVDSNPEYKVAEKLIAENRRFWKPLKYDANEDVFPDFILSDTINPEVPMEVFGMDTLEYRERMAKKIVFYDTKYGKNEWWYWDAIKNNSIPPFPNKYPHQG